MSAPFVARGDVLHLVALEHEPYTIHPNGAHTAAITTTACRIHLQGVPLDGPTNSLDRYCRRCEQAMARFGASA